MMRKVTIIPYDDYNSRVPSQNEWDYIGTITSNCGSSALRNGYKIIDVYEQQGLAPTLNTMGGGNSEPQIIEEQMEEKVINYRIRKLTPRECFRLMDVDESNIDKIQAAGISKTQQYKMAGNSIVVACMEGIFRNLFDASIEPDTLF